MLEIEKSKKQTDDESKIIKKLLSKGYTDQEIKKYLK
jgi:SOS response regulatory protein OraA/RecX